MTAKQSGYTGTSSGAYGAPGMNMSRDMGQHMVMSPPAINTAGDLGALANREHMKIQEFSAFERTLMEEVRTYVTQENPQKPYQDVEIAAHINSEKAEDHSFHKVTRVDVARARNALEIPTPQVRRL